MAEFLRVERICKDFVLRQGPFRRTTRVVHAVREVTLDVPEGATFGLVGESGSGKSTLARLILGLDTPTSGTVWLRGRNLHELSGKGPKAWHREAQLIFQDAYGALSPRMRTGRILAEPLRPSSSPCSASTCSLTGWRTCSTLGSN
jgi:peptide/nickel transport system ATP-binding protein